VIFDSRGSKATPKLPSSKLVSASGGEPISLPD
jgi:hypothetical protein